MPTPNMNVILAGVVPPPVHGASMCTRALFDADLNPIEKHLLEIRSSKDLQNVGRASLGKVIGLFALVARCWVLKFRSKAQVLYYTPGSANFVPFVRDVIFLSACRWMFRRTVLHYHSGGLNDYLASKKWRHLIGKWIYGRGAWAITLSEHVAVPDMHYGAAKVIEIPNGIHMNEVPKQAKTSSDHLRILFVGNLFEDKGIFDLLAACDSISSTTQTKIRLQMVGKWPDDITEKKFRSTLAQLSSQRKNLEVMEPCALYGDEKWRAYSQSDLFVFPTYYRSENFPLVLLEAMACGLPLISTNWRGIPSIVKENFNGLLYDPKNIQQLQNCILCFIKSPELLNTMGQNSLSLYYEKFTFEKYRENIVNTLSLACNH